MRVIFAHHLADDARRLDVLLVPVEPEFLHRIEDAPVHGLETVTHIWQRARDDHAHRVLEVRTLHLVDDLHRPDVARAVAAVLVVVAIVCQECPFLTALAGRPAAVFQPVAAPVRGEGEFVPVV